MKKAKEAVEAEREKMKKAKEAVEAEKAALAVKREQLAKQEAKIREWIKTQPDAAVLATNDS
jgi:small-conductance mechanosensitive channel